MNSFRRFATKGVDGVRLEIVRFGRRWFTSAEAIARFMKALTEGRANQRPDAEPTAPSTADARLDELGF